MKKSLFLLTLCLISLNTLAQLFPKDGNKWTADKAINTVGSNPTLIIDDKVTATTKLNPEEIASITVSDPSKKLKKKHNAQKSTTGYIQVITKPYAIAKYQPRLMEISSDYKMLVQNYSKTNDNILYITDGEIVNPTVEGRLYSLRLKKIKEIKVIKPEDAINEYGDKAKLGVVILNSRKYLNRKN